METTTDQIDVQPEDVIVFDKNRSCVLFGERVLHEGDMTLDAFVEFCHDRLNVSQFWGLRFSIDSNTKNPNCTIVQNN